MSKFIEPDPELEALVKVVVDAAYEVHHTLGPGYQEKVYEEALAVELGLRDIPFARQVVVPVSYKGRMVGEGRLDLLIGGRLIVELKVVDKLLPLHTAQCISYLKATRNPLALLINFNSALFKYGIRRVVYTKNLAS
ncbi:MAG: GxxExxY protein [Chloroflexi bacterium]|nr:MAG: GxxExxY protein [Chloroflexota bacterium]